MDEKFVDDEPDVDMAKHNPQCLTLADVTRMEREVQDRAFAHMNGVWKAHCHRLTHKDCYPGTCGDAPEDPAFQDFCGCGTCIVREILMSGYQTLRVLAQVGAMTGDVAGEA